MRRNLENPNVIRRYDLYGITCVEYKTPPDSKDVQFVSLDTLGSTVRVQVKIKGIVFKRLNDRALKNNKPIWCDEQQVFVQDSVFLEDADRDELEAIFQNYISEHKIDLDEIIDGRSRRKLIE